MTVAPMVFVVRSGVRRRFWLVRFGATALAPQRIARTKRAFPVERRRPGAASSLRSDLLRPVQRERYDGTRALLDQGLKLGALSP